MTKAIENLTIDEVMTLYQFGMSTPEILIMECKNFTQLSYNNPKLKEYLDRINNILIRQKQLGIVSLSCRDKDFPKSLLNIGEDCPPVIHCTGNIDLLKRTDNIAIIGARAADKQGNAIAYKLGHKYGQIGKVIVSGLALGCDTSAHYGCLDVGGATIAIVGSGLDICHPKENKPLEQMILQQGGLLISEQIIGVKANPTRLIARNRLQAAMSHIVILAQCPIQSGSLHTMNFARKYGRECLAATFPYRTDKNAGNYALIDSGQANPLVI